MMRHNGYVLGWAALTLSCSAGLAAAQATNHNTSSRSYYSVSGGKKAGTNRPQNTNVRAQTNENETGAEPSHQEMSGVRRDAAQTLTLDTSKHLSDMSVDVIDAKMKLSVTQREQVQAILDSQKTQMQTLVLSSDKQGEPDAVLAMQKQRAEVSRQTSRDIAMTLNSEQRNQIASLMTQEYNRALALQAKPGSVGTSEQRLSQNQRSVPKSFHLHRQYRAAGSPQP